MSDNDTIESLRRELEESRKREAAMAAALESSNATFNELGDQDWPGDNDRISAQVAHNERALSAPSDYVPLARFWNEQAEWSRATFGSDQERGPVGPLKHLIKEANEALKDPSDLIEFCDCLFLIFDATRRAGFTLDQLVNGCFEKLTKNKARKWSKPTSDEPVEHDRSGEHPLPSDYIAKSAVRPLVEALRKAAHSLAWCEPLEGETCEGEVTTEQSEEWKDEAEEAVDAALSLARELGLEVGQ